MKRLALVFALGGCDAVFGLDTPKLHDATGSGDIDAGLTCVDKVGKYGPPKAVGWLEYCAVDGAVMLSASIDTKNDPMCASHATSVCLIEGATISILQGTTVTVSGTKPLVLAASHSIDIAGVLDVSSSDVATGPAANFGNCQVSTPGGTGSATGGGGGGGGSWFTSGGMGGIGGGLTNRAPGGGPGLTFDPPTEPRGGCAGASGGDSGGGGAGGHAGDSGGAVYLTSPIVGIESSAKIKSLGTGGRGGGSSINNGGGGGGGGGTGGLIVFDTGMLTVGSAAAIFANGGGGGGGGDKAAPGVDGTISDAPDVAAGGGSQGMNGGGVGGNGAIGRNDAGGGADAGTATSGGGGGGGGGQGFILLFSTMAGPSIDDGRFSPPVIIE